MIHRDALSEDSKYCWVAEIGFLPSLIIIPSNFRILRTSLASPSKHSKIYPTALWVDKPHQEKFLTPKPCKSMVILKFLNPRISFGLEAILQDPSEGYLFLVVWP